MNRLGYVIQILRVCSYSARPQRILSRFAKLIGREELLGVRPVMLTLNGRLLEVRLTPSTATYFSDALAVTRHPCNPLTSQTLQFVLGPLQFSLI